MMVLTTAERQQLEALRKKAAAHHGLYVGDALRYAQLLGQKGLTRPKIMLAGRKGHLGMYRPPGSKWWMFDAERLETWYGPPKNTQS